MSRKSARIYTYQLVFGYLFQEEKDKHTFDIFSGADLSEQDIDYMQKTYEGVIAKKDELLSAIEKYSNGFAIDRIYKTDLAALMVAIYEMKYIDDIPYSVSINEAVELVKTYSTERSHSFVNGILASVYKELLE